MDSKHIRERNLIALIRKVGTAAEVAEKVGSSPSYISQILSSKSKGAVGDSLARKLETAFSLPYGWMDLPHAAAEIHNFQDKGIQTVQYSQVKTPLVRVDEIKDFLNGVTKVKEINMDIPSYLVKEKAIVMIAEGDSMRSKDNIEESICDGDFLYLDILSSPQKGDRVVVEVEGKIKIRKLERDGTEFVLKPLNSQYPIIPYTDEVKIIGVIRLIQKPPLTISKESN